MAQNSNTQSPPTPAILLDCKLTPDEASLILNKLNASQFAGFSESALALSILGKIQNSAKIPAVAMTPNQMDSIKNAPPTDISQLKEQNKKSVAFIPPEKSSPVSKVEDEEDSRPGPPLRSLGEIIPSALSEDEVVPSDDAPAFGVINRSSKNPSDQYI